LRDVEEALQGLPPATAPAAAAAAVRHIGVDAVEDPQVAADYRAHLAAVAVGRAVAAAVAGDARCRT
jgi:CO/xanthine dehydrogenase FAD-binding subunit